MNAHRLAEERSVAYQSLIAERLPSQPEVLASARRRVQGWLEAAQMAPFYARKWAEILNGDVPSIAAFLRERSELADELRQSSPFAGALKPEERWRIIRETRERFSQQSWPGSSSSTSFALPGVAWGFLPWGWGLIRA